ncbi:MAG: long-chain fatty acid--CoA ligase [Bacteroidia bacterium]|nr:long-chain fatty acid--CoA ligase [Bacteroidia bacterium]
MLLSHKTVMERTAAACEGLPITAYDRIVWVLPMAYHFVVSLMLYIRYGAGIIVCEDFLADAILNDIQKYRGTLLYASPMHIRLLASHNAPVNLPTLRRVISTTTGISPTVCHAFYKKFHIPVWQAFGIIEVGLPVVNQQKAVERPDAVGHVLPAYEAAILDDRGRKLPAGCQGRLALKGPGMFDGYLSPKLPRDTVLKEGWFLTGDLAMMEDDGLITINGREKSVINVSGNKVFPSEVEEVINTYPGVVQSRVYAHAHPLVGEIVAAEVVLQGASRFDEEDLIQYCRAKLTSFKIPQRISVVERIAMTGSGKIKR